MTHCVGVNVRMMVVRNRRLKAQTVENFAWAVTKPRLKPPKWRGKSGKQQSSQVLEFHHPQSIHHLYPPLYKREVRKQCITP